MCSTWFKHDDPTPIAMDGHKMKLNYNVANGMMYNGLAACLRVFDEKEMAMMANVHEDPVWRCLTGLELAVSLHAPHPTMDSKNAVNNLAFFPLLLASFQHNAEPRRAAGGYVHVLHRDKGF
jgi:hypothetical protein